MESSNVVRLCGSSWSECGYCKGERAWIVERPPNESSKACSLLADRLSTPLYEALVYRGWRRSGTALYKPDNPVSCCPALTIRLPVNNFTPTKSQRKVWKRMESLLQPRRSCPKNQSSVSRVVEQIVNESGILKTLQTWTQEALVDILGNDYPNSNQSLSFKVVQNKGKKKQSKNRITVSTAICAALAGPSKGKIDRNTLSKQLLEALMEKHCQSTHNGDRKKRPHMDPDISIDRIERHEASGQILVHLNVPPDMNSTNDNVDMQEEEDSNRDRLAMWWKENQTKPLPPPPYNLTVDTLPAHESALDPKVHELYFDYQRVVHDDPNPFTDEIKDDGAEVWGRKAPEHWMEAACHMLQIKYQHLSTERQRRLKQAYGQFYEFLVENPFQPASANTSTMAGTYHQQYRIAGVLVAVGVVDILPQGLSSVYLFYDPSFAQQLVPLGKYAILYEIEWTRQQNWPYYYLGYYIHSCPKMRYKADYRPSQLLCPHTNRWVGAEAAKETIDRESPQQHCCRLDKTSTDDTSDDEQQAIQSAVHQVRMEAGMGRMLTLHMLHGRGRELVQPLLEEFVTQAGPQNSLQCVVDFR